MDIANVETVNLLAHAKKKAIICTWSLREDPDSPLLHVICEQNHKNQIRLLAKYKFSKKKLELDESKAMVSPKSKQLTKHVMNIFRIEMKKLRLQNRDLTTPWVNLTASLSLDQPEKSTWFAMKMKNCFSKWFNLIYSQYQEQDPSFTKALVPRVNMSNITSIDIYGLSYLHIASAHNWQDMLRSLFDQNSNLDVNHQVSHDHSEFAGFTALHFAVMNEQHNTALDLLLKHNARFTIVNSESVSALHMAYYKKNKDLIKLMLSLHSRDFGTCPVDQTGLSHLHLACMYNMTDIARGLLRGGSADVNGRISEEVDKWPGCTSLHIAADYEDVDLTTVLLRAGADPNKQCKVGRTPLHRICTHGTTKINKLLTLIIDRRLEEIEEWVTGMKQLRIVDALLVRNADVNVVDVIGKSPIFYLYDIRREKMMLHLLRDRGYPEESKIKLIRRKRDEVARKLIDSDADLRLADKTGTNILHWIVYAKRNDVNPCEFAEYVCKLMINAEIKPWAGGDPPLFRFSSLGNETRVIGLLLESGEDPNAVKDATLASPFHCYVRFLFNMSPRQERHYDLLKKFVEYGGNVNHRLRNGKSILHVIFSRTNRNGWVQAAPQPDFVHFERRNKIFLNFRNDINAQDNSGRTPLHYALLRHDIFEANLLIGQGADYEILDNKGKTPLNCCSIPECSMRIHAGRFVKKLVALGIPVSEQNQKLIEGSRDHADRAIEEKKVNEMHVKELRKLKTIKIGRGTSLYDMIFMTGNRLAIFAKMPKYLEEITRTDKAMLFTQSILNLQYRRGKARGELLESAKRAVISISKINLPVLCCEWIIDYLDNRNLKSLIAAVENH